MANNNVFIKEKMNESRPSLLAVSHIPRIGCQPEKTTLDGGQSRSWSAEHVCVCVFSSHPFWTSMDVPAGVTQEEGHTGFLIHLPSAVRALIFVARRIQPFLSLVDREVEFCVLTN